MFSRTIGLLFVLLAVSVFARHNYTIDQKMRDDSDLSQFYSMMDLDRGVKTMLEYRPVTIFAPLNSAFQKFKGKTDESLVLYHITNSALMLNELRYSVSSEFEGNPPLWITRVRYQNRDEIYVNNAKVVQQRSNVVQNNNIGKKQVLHVIEGVLEPVKSTSPEISIYNPNAYEFMNNSENIDLESHRIRSFRHRVNVNRKQNVFTSEGKYTFFIPVDEGFQPPPRPDKIDSAVIDGHVIPNKVLFTAPTEDGQEFETLSYTDTLKVTISFSTETDGKEVRKYVKSHTIVGDQQHPNGVVLAEIVKANIPVKNGVVHLIHRPLMVVDTTVTEFLEEKEDGPLYKLYEVIHDSDGDFMERLTKMRNLTLFAPSNAAWRDPSLNNILRDRKKMRDILNIHLVEDKLPLETIIYKNIKQADTLINHKKLYFNVINVNGNKTLTVEGGGVNATVIQPDIAATNGIIHIIDRVLGVPFTTVGRKIATDPMLNTTYQLGKQQGFNDQLDDMNKRFTYFVPRDYAWVRLETRSPSVHKKLFMHEFAYHARQILERHLVVAERSFSMSELANMTILEARQLPTVRDIVKVKVKESEKNFYIEWDNEWIHVFRPDVECTNGVIHVIDKVFIRDRDVYVTGSGYHLHPTFGFVFCLLLSRYL